MMLVRKINCYWCLLIEYFIKLNFDFCDDLNWRSRELWQGFNLSENFRILSVIGEIY